MQNINSVKSQVNQRVLWQSMRSRYFFPKVSVNCLIHLSDHRRLLVISHTVFPMWWVRVSYFSSPTTFSFLKSSYIRILEILTKICSAQNWIWCFLFLFKLCFSEEGWGRVGQRFWSCVKSQGGYVCGEGWLLFSDTAYAV